MATFPRVHAMVVCDEGQLQHGDPASYDLRGVRTEIRAPIFPHVHPLFCVYLQVAGHEGTVNCHLKVVRADQESLEHVDTEQEVTLEGPLAIIHLLWWIERCTFPEPGLYYIQFYAGSKLLNERLLILSQGGDSGNGQETP